MYKVNTLPDTAKWKVDAYRESESFSNGQPAGTLICICYKEDADGYEEKKVTLDELASSVRNNKGMVEYTNPCDSQETLTIDFLSWYNDVRHSIDLHNTLADIINKREKPAIVFETVNELKQRRA